MKRILSDSYRRSIDNKINRIVSSHKNQRNTKHASFLKTENVFVDFSEKDAKFIYSEKCKDLDIPSSANAEKKFIEQFVGSIHNKSLRFCGLGLGPGAAKALLKLLWNQKKYFYIDLSLNRLADAGCIAVADYIKSNPPVIFLDLRSNSITMEGASALFMALKSNDQVVYIDMSAIDGIDRNRMSSHGCKALAELLKENEIITHLNMSMSGISVEGCVFLSTALAMNKNLAFLDLSGNRFGTQGTCNLFKENNSFGHVETLILARNDIGDGSALSICRQIQQSKTIRVLDFTDNNLSTFFIKKLIRSVHETPLTTLLLSHNKIGVKCSDYLHFLIRNIPTLQVLDLSFNPLKDVTVIQICDALIWNTGLLSIDLSETLITDESGKSFAEVIEMNKTLQKLILNNNQISDESFTPIAKALTKNSTLTQLSLRSNEINDDSAQAIIEALQLNNTILDVDLDFNDFSYRTNVQLVNAIAAHKKLILENIHEVAQKKIEELKIDEQKLLDVREEVKRQTEAVIENREEKNRKVDLLKDLAQERKMSLIEAHQQIEELENEYNKVSEQHRMQLAEFNRIRAEIESSQANALNKQKATATRRQHAAARLQRSNEKKLEAQMEANKILDDLKVHLSTIKDELRNAIDDAHIQQKLLAQKELEEKQAAQAKALAEKMLKKKNGQKTTSSKSAPKFMTLAERRKSTTKMAARLQNLRLKVAQNPQSVPIVTPELNLDNDQK